MLREVVIILLKTYGAIVAANVVLILFMLFIHIREERRKVRVRTKKERQAAQFTKDDQIFEEVDRFYGAPW